MINKAFKWIGGKIAAGAARKAPKELLSGILDLVETPPERLLQALEKAHSHIDNHVTEQDQKLIIDVLRTTARLYVKYGAVA